MFCIQCGTENQAEARYCQKCGVSQSGSIPQPTSSVRAVVEEGAIWNPNAAANWSLIFTPAFGAYLQMRNWNTLHEPEKAAAAKNWFYVSLGMLAIYVLLGILMQNTDAAEGAARALGVLFLLVWYFSVGRAQAKYVKEKSGPDYARKPWGKALLLGIASLIGYFVFAVILNVIAGSVK